MDRSTAILGMLVFAFGCARATPAGFWLTYRADLIKQKFSDQGPWGGVRWVLCESAAVNTFHVSHVLDFARLKGWSCGAPVQYSEDQMRLWQYSERTVALLVERDSLFCPVLILEADGSEGEQVVAFTGAPEIFTWQETELLSIRVYYKGMGALQQSLFFTVLDNQVVHLEEQPYPKAAVSAGWIPSSHGGGF